MVSWSSGVTCLYLPEFVQNPAYERPETSHDRGGGVKAFHLLLKASGADIVATACEMCYAQLSELVDKYELDMKVEFVSNLVAQAVAD